MNANATWWVTYRDQHGRNQLLSLASPDLSDPKAAVKRAAKTAKDRLAKRGVRATITNVRCVG